MPRASAPKNSLRQLQDKALKDNSLELIGADELSFAPISMDAVQAALYELAIEFMLEAKKNLDIADKVSKGALMDSIIPTSIEINGEVLTIGISVLEYYKFVDKGVKGWQSGGGNSPYQFKAPSGGKHDGKSKFVEAIREWVIREGIKTSAASTKGKSRDSKRKSKKKFTDTNTRTAIIIAGNIRKRGLEPTHFWTKTEDEMMKRIKDKFKVALKVDIINNIANGTSS